eukprot:TRINITY_DN1293_c2_g1_i1.p1 TRINITY_DN1293_c2_g1~~TRINITY_DN1293_c2_g1_i1.p1  ORF type:complete len:144 (-),score=27.39 TRINITY_DN1293_c2_g1_i1:142-573(-)
MWVLSLLRQLFSVFVILVGYFYPLNITYKALKCNDFVEKRNVISFWIIMGPLLALESFYLTRIPMYFEMKLLLIGWLCWNQMQGAHALYSALIAPFLTRYEESIDVFSAKQLNTIRQTSISCITSQLPKALALLSSSNSTVTS